MKLHRWYSAFRNLGFWAICVFVALFVVPWFYPSVHRIHLVLSGIALAVLPVVFIPIFHHQGLAAGVNFCYNTSP